MIITSGTWRRLAPGVLLCATASLLVLSVFAPRADGWGGEHHAITESAITALPPEQREYIAPEKAALVQTYCGFPDSNWACMGEWGGGVGDPKMARFPDTRREWDISYYCQWDPVLRKGQGFPHKAPESYEATRVYFLKAVAELKQGRLEDGMRSVGVMFHYIQDSGSFGHMQPIHRVFHVRELKAIQLEDSQLRLLASSPEEAAKALSERLRGMVESTEKRVAPLLEAAGMPFEEAKGLCNRETMPATVVKAVERARAYAPRLCMR